MRTTTKIYINKTVGITASYLSIYFFKKKRKFVFISTITSSLLVDVTVLKYEVVATGEVLQHISNYIYVSSMHRLIANSVSSTKDANSSTSLRYTALQQLAPRHSGPISHCCHSN